MKLLHILKHQTTALLLLTIALFQANMVLAEPLEIPELVKDINIVGDSSLLDYSLCPPLTSPSGIRPYEQPKPFAIGSTIYFCATTSENGAELWKSDGTDQGTILIKDIRQGLGNSTPRNFIKIDNTLFFTANDGTNGEALWKSDGTETGTVLVKIFNSGSDLVFRFGAAFTNVSGTLYFVADDGIHGRELWKSDGTEEGTLLVSNNLDFMADINLIDINGTLFFTAIDSIHGNELWKTDGTEAGTVLIKDINIGATRSNPLHFTNINGTLFFIADDGTHGKELWKSDGTEAGTVLVKDIGSTDFLPTELTNANGTLFFRADDGIHGIELWKSDGTEAGTIMVKDIYTADQSDKTSSSFPHSLTSINETLFFSAYDEINGAELWKSDGTEAGTVLVKDIENGLNSSYPRKLTNINGTLFFKANHRLWKSDGTEIGTVFVRNITPDNLTNVNGTLFFKSNNKLWKSDGTTNGTSEVTVTQISTTNHSSHPTQLTNINGILLFTANDEVNGKELWKSDGTENGTTLVKNITNGSDDSFIRELTQVDENAFFKVNSNISGYGSAGLWKTDGSEVGTTLIKTFNPSSYYSHNLSELTSVNGTLFFNAENGSYGKELWKSDGTEAGTILVKDIETGTESSRPNDLTNVNGTLFFTAINGNIGRELWKTDGTESGTILVKDIRPETNNSGFPLSSYPSSLININGTLFFSANDGANGSELWKSDGTEAGTIMVKDINPGTISGYPSSSNPHNLTNINGTLFFSANDEINGKELWKSDGTEAGTIMVKDIYTGTRNNSPRDSYPSDLTNINGTLFFTARDGISGRELWKSDGTEAGTTIVKDISTGTFSGFPRSSNPKKLININGVLYFHASNRINGRELWKSDGTEAGTLMIYDITPGVTSSISSNANLTNINEILFFTANDGQHGEELWKLTVTPPTISPPEITSHEPGSTLSGFNQTFNWTNNGTTITEWWLSVGSSEGAHDFHHSDSLGTATTDTVYGLPTDGSTVYVRLWYKEVEGGIWKYVDTSYTADNSGVQVKPEILTPISGSILPGHTTLFTWSANVTNVLEWWLFVGTSQGTYDLHNSNSLSELTTTANVRGLPTDGSTVFVRLWYKEAGGAWKYLDTTYIADDSGTDVKPTITSPIPGSILSNPVETFIWTHNATSSTEWWLYAGSSEGMNDIYDSGSIAGQITTISAHGLPTDGSAVFVRLWYREEIGGIWKYVDVAYNISGNSQSKVTIK